MRKIIIAGNWKMNKTIGESISMVKELRKLVEGIEDRSVLVCPPFTALSSVSAELKGSNVSLGAQNMHFEGEGAFTGEISASMLKEIGVEYVILGHSERRHIFNEDDSLINKKIKTAISNGLRAILCVGETLEEREDGKMEDVVCGQISNCLEGIDDMENIVIAYEPVWAIGTGKTASPSQAEEAHVLIRNVLGSIFDDTVSEGVTILYGGSVKPGNIKELISQDNIDGVLVGGASLDAKNFSEIVKC